MVCIDKHMHKTYYILIGLMVLLLPQAFILPVEFRKSRSICIRYWFYKYVI